METGQLTVFTLGQSTVVTLPKKWAVKPGGRIKYTKSAKNIKLEIKDNNLDQAKVAAHKAAGSFKYKLKRPYPTLKEMSDAYEKDTYGDVFPGY